MAFELMTGQLNQEWVPRDTFFHLVVWENFIDAMSREGLQQEYNKAIQGCDIFVLLFFTKVGDDMAEEFELVFGAFGTLEQATDLHLLQGCPNPHGHHRRASRSLLEFKKKLRSLNHYYTRYRMPRS